MASNTKKFHNLFDYVNSLNNKEYLGDQLSNKEYNQYMVNRALSLYPDTIFFVNELNQYSTISNRQHYDFLYYGISKRKRWSKWFKKESDDILDLIQEYYDVDSTTAGEVSTLLTDENIQEIRVRLEKGGR